MIDLDEKKSAGNNFSCAHCALEYTAAIFCFIFLVPSPFRTPASDSHQLPNSSFLPAYSSSLRKLKPYSRNTLIYQTSEFTHVFIYTLIFSSL